MALLRTRALVARPLHPCLRTSPLAISRIQRRHASSAEDDLDPDMNGGYISPPRVKRQHRDPYADWWDKQERRNYGEPIHEDNDILGIFSPEDYTHATSGHAARMFGSAILAVLGLCGVTYYLYPDKPSAPRTFPDGLEAEYGGPGALPAAREEDAQ